MFIKSLIPLAVQATIATVLVLLVGYIVGINAAWFVCGAAQMYLLPKVYAWCLTEEKRELVVPRCTLADEDKAAARRYVPGPDAQTTHENGYW